MVKSDGFENRCPSGLTGSNPVPSASQILLRKSEAEQHTFNVCNLAGNSQAPNLFNSRPF